MYNCTAMDVNRKSIFFATSNDSNGLEEQYLHISIFPQTVQHLDGQSD